MDARGSRRLLALEQGHGQDPEEGAQGDAGALSRGSVSSRRPVNRSR